MRERQREPEQISVPERKTGRENRTYRAPPEEELINSVEYSTEEGGQNIPTKLLILNKRSFKQPNMKISQYLFTNCKKGLYYFLYHNTKHISKHLESKKTINKTRGL